MDLDMEEIRKKAYDELYADKFREAVESEKERLRQKKSFMDIIFPWKILIIKKD